MCQGDTTENQSISPDTVVFLCVRYFALHNENTK